METQGNDNTAVGFYALRNVDGSYNVAIGSQAMLAYTFGANETRRAWYNVAVGYQALKEISGGEQNVAVGFQALADGCVDGSHNVVIGSKAGRTLGACADWGAASRNTFVGGHAGEYGSGGLRNGVALGYEAGQYMIAAGNVAIGYKSMRLGGSVIGASTPSVTIGNLAGEMMSDGSGGNVAVGGSALQMCISGCYNVAVGTGALSSLAGEVIYPWNSSNNVAVGRGALQSATKAMNNTIIGTLAGGRLGDGSGNVAIGYEAMWGATNPTNNIWGCVAVGYEAARYIRAPEQVAIGNKALRAGGNNAVPGVTGNSVAVGNRALEELGQDGSGGNVALGGCALCQSISGGWNTALGNGALYNNTGGNYNVGVGAHALNSLVSGSNNTALGRWAGRGMSTGNFDGLLILNATGNDFPTGLATDVSNSFFVKPVREATQSNALYYNPTSGEVTHSGAGGTASGGYGYKMITTDGLDVGWFELLCTRTSQGFL